MVREMARFAFGAFLRERRQPHLEIFREKRKAAFSTSRFAPGSRLLPAKDPLELKLYKTSLGHQILRTIDD
jgi:hypothetical protein